MKLNYNGLLSFVETFNAQVLLDNGRCQIQKLYSTPHFVCICMRTPGQNHCLYIGRGGDYQGVWLEEKPPRSEYRIKDQFLEFLRKKLTNGFIKKVKLDEQDRIISVNYIKSGLENSIYFFWKGSTLYFSHETDKDYFISWQGKKINKMDLGANNFEVFSDVGRKLLERKIVKPTSFHFDNYFLTFFNKFSRQKSINRKEKYYLNKIKNITHDLSVVTNWKDIEEDICHPDFKFPSGKNPKLRGVRVALEADWSHYKKVSFTYEKLKKLKKAEMILQSRKMQTEEEYKNWLATRKAEISNVKIIYPCWNRQVTKSPTEKKVNALFFTYEGGVTLGVGKDASGNDYLRNSWGKKNDWWVHIDNYTSSHCIVKITGSENLSTTLLALIGSVLRDRSDYKFEEIPLVFTQIKNIKGAKGKTGGVLIKKAKYLRVYYNQKWENYLNYTSN